LWYPGGREEEPVSLLDGNQWGKVEGIKLELRHQRVWSKED